VSPVLLVGDLVLGDGEFREINFANGHRGQRDPPRSATTAADFALIVRDIQSGVVTHPERTLGNCDHDRFDRPHVETHFLALLDRNLLGPNQHASHGENYPKNHKNSDWLHWAHLVVRDHVRSRRFDYRGGRI
jgi:hypothetical protein